MGMTRGSNTSPGSDPGKGVLPPHPVLQKEKLRPQAELAGRVQTRGRCAPRHTQDSGSHGVCSPLRGRAVLIAPRALASRRAPFLLGTLRLALGEGQAWGSGA